MSKFNLFARPLVFWNRKEFYQWLLTKEWVISNIIRSGSIYRLTGSFCLDASLCLLRHTLQLHHRFTMLLLLLSKGLKCFVVSFAEEKNELTIRKQKHKIYCKNTYSSSLMYLIRLLTFSLASFSSIFISAGPINLNVFVLSSIKSSS